MILKSLSHLILVIRLQARQAWYHRAAAGAIVLTWGLRMGLTILLYYGIYGVLNADDIKGIDLSVAVSSIILYSIFSGFGSRDVYRLINEDFKSGNIEIWLNKPISYLIIKVGENIGKNIPSASALIGTAGLFWMCMGLPNVDDIGLRFLLALPLLFFGVVLAHLLYILVGLSVVWLHDATATFLIVDKIVMVFGGAYIPIAFFPEYFRTIGEVLPMGSITFVAQMFYPDFFDNYLRFVGLIFLWIFVLGGFLYAVSKSVSRRMTVNGG